jgi:CSLREA domain-containing protein
MQKEKQMNNQPRSRWMLKALLVFVTVTLLAGQAILPALGKPITPDDLPARNAPTATITVDTTDDELNSDGDCSLREAMTAANTNAAVDNCAAGSGADTIDFSVDGPITLGSTLPFIDDDVTIDGTGHSVAVSGGGTVRVLVVNGGVAVSINTLTIQNGFTDIVVGVTTKEGGGIFNFGNLTVTNSTFSGNQATDKGGAISNGGALTVTNSTFSSNTAGGTGGGI